MSDEIRWRKEWKWLPRQVLLRMLRQELTVEDMVARLYRVVPDMAVHEYLDTEPTSKTKLTLDEQHREGVAVMVRDVLAECLLRGEVSQSSKDGRTTYVACVDAREVTDAECPFDCSVRRMVQCRRSLTCPLACRWPRPTA